MGQVRGQERTAGVTQVLVKCGTRREDKGLFSSSFEDEGKRAQSEKRRSLQNRNASTFNFLHHVVAEDYSRLTERCATKAHLLQDTIGNQSRLIEANKTCI